ncbi:MAG: hypothetical protein KDB52_03730 [Solirubrobacterales bacterium]|nr:hypothetical protein [Solirubrobacterales bacterium]
MNSRETRRFAAAVAAVTLFAVTFAFFGASSATAAKPKCTIKGTKGSDRIYGTKGRDVICGFAGKDRIWGLTGHDIIRGGRGDDVIRAGKGNDRLFGQPDDDTLYAGLGNDFLDGGQGENSLFTGPGNNRCLDSATDTVTPGCDDTAPRIESFEVLNPTINTETEAAWVRFTIRITDDLSGLRHEPSLSLIHPATGQRQWAWVQHTSGDQMDSTYSGQVLMPHYSAQGRWELNLSFDDKQGNRDELDSKALAKLGFANGFDQVGIGDSEKPEIHSVSVDRTSVNTSSGPQTVTFTIRVTDDASGIPIEQFNAVDVSARFMDNYNVQFMASNFTRISGTDTDGVYRGSITLPRYTKQGTMALFAAAIDRAGNAGGLMPDELKQRGFPDKLHQTGPGDTEKPKVIAFSVTPDQIDTTTESAVVSVSLRATDNLAGVGDYGVTVNALPANGNGFGEFLTRTSGTSLDGIYEGTIEIPEGTALGTIRLSPTVWDEAQNWGSYSFTELSNLGFDYEVGNGPIP